jgi:hypothetical protein
MYLAFDPWQQQIGRAVTDLTKLQDFKANEDASTTTTISHHHSFAID